MTEHAIRALRQQRGAPSPTRPATGDTVRPCNAITCARTLVPRITAEIEARAEDDQSTSVRRKIIRRR